MRRLMLSNDNPRPKKSLRFCHTLLLSLFLTHTHTHTLTHTHTQTRTPPPPPPTYTRHTHTRRSKRKITAQRQIFHNPSRRLPPRRLSLFRVSSYFGGGEESA